MARRQAGLDAERVRVDLSVGCDVATGQRDANARGIDAAAASIVEAGRDPGVRSACQYLTGSRRKVDHVRRLVVHRLCRGHQRKTRAHGAVADAQRGDDRARRIRIVRAPDRISALVGAGAHLAQRDVVGDAGQVDRHRCAGNPDQAEAQLGTRFDPVDGGEREALDARCDRRGDHRRRRSRNDRWSVHRFGQRHTGRGRASAGAKRRPHLTAFVHQVGAFDRVAPDVHTGTDFAQRDRLTNAADAQRGHAARRSHHLDAQPRAWGEIAIRLDLDRAQLERGLLGRGDRRHRDQCRGTRHQQTGCGNPAS